MDRNDFFREMTLRISSSLDLTTAMHRCIAWMGTVLPVRRMLLALYEPEHGAARFLVDATRERATSLDERLSLPPELRGIIEDLVGSPALRTPLVQEGSRTPVGAMIESFLGEARGSGWTMLLEVEGHKLAMLGWFPVLGQTLAPEHRELLASLHAPFSLAVANALSHRANVELQRALAEDNRVLRRRLSQLRDGELVGRDSGLSGVMRMVHQVASLTTPVLLLGETGVGKDVVARTIHDLSARHGAPFVKVGCGAMPDGLMDSELFGHERGAFTGAVRAHQGYFERAAHGTIFLDEVGELSLPAQARLLDVLQTHEIERVGAEARTQVDIRVIAATHRDLEQMVEDGSFRRDLWFRLSVFPIRIPALRERPQDIPLLLQHFVERHARRLGFGSSPRLPLDALDRLTRHAWPGNIREFSNLIERALILGNGEHLVLDPLLPGLGGVELRRVDSATVLAPMTLEQTITQAIEGALRRSGGKVSGPGGAAVLLGLHPNTLRSKMKKLGIATG
ncbi:MAG: sigma-54 dependent transcriptional regulator [Myxococcota bacterium]